MYCLGSLGFELAIGSTYAGPVCWLLGLRWLVTLGASFLLRDSTQPRRLAEVPPRAPLPRLSTRGFEGTAVRKTSRDDRSCSCEVSGREERPGPDCGSSDVFGRRQRACLVSVRASRGRREAAGATTGPFGPSRSRRPISPRSFVHRERGGADVE